MGTLDLYEDGFPHGTKEGFAKGCKGIACPNNGTEVVTCKVAFSRFNSDYGFRKMVESGLSPEEIAQVESVPLVPKPRPSKPLTVKPVVEVDLEEEVAAEPVEEPAEEPSGPVESVALVRGRHGSVSHYEKGCRHPACVAAHEVVGESAVVEDKHGTMAGYQRGCKDESACPGGADGKTCSQASRDYQRDYKRRKTEERRSKSADVERGRKTVAALTDRTAPLEETVDAPALWSR